MTPRTVKLAAAALALAGIRALGGAAIYASIAPGATTTVVADSAGAPAKSHTLRIALGTRPA
jgi:hypothetical protein